MTEFAIQEFKGVPVKQVAAQITAIQRLMLEVMKEGEHFGVIPGTNKKSLYKAGAEKIGLTFRLAPAYEVESKDLPGGHLMVTVKCTLSHIVNGTVWGQGLGICSTMEGKYRFREGPPEVTTKPVPQAFWKERDPALLGGNDFKPVKVDGKWFIGKKTGSKIECENPADYYNTVIKMAKKRAHVDAILTATAASDIFTQDIRDMEIDTDENPDPVAA